MSYLISFIEDYGLLFVFANVLVSRAGAPIPAYPTLIITGAFIARGHYSAEVLISTVVGAAILADSLWYLAGRRFGMGVLRTLCRVSLSPDSCVRQTESIFSRFGSASMLFAKFIPGFASVSTALAGAIRMRYWKFLLFDSIGAAIWAGVAAWLGYVFRDAVHELLTTIEALGRFGLMLVAAAFAAYVAFKWWQRYLFIKQLRMDRITVPELRQLMAEAGVNTILDVRSAITQAATGRIPGSRTVDLKTIEESLRGMEVHGEVVVYCACPNEASAVKVAQQLKRLGFNRVRPLAGGIEAWIAAGLQVER